PGSRLLEHRGGQAVDPRIQRLDPRDRRIDQLQRAGLAAYDQIGLAEGVELPQLRHQTFPAITGPGGVTARRARGTAAREGGGYGTPGGRRSSQRATTRPRG